MGSVSGGMMNPAVAVTWLKLSREWVALEGFSFGPDDLEKSYQKCWE